MMWAKAKTTVSEPVIFPLQFCVYFSVSCHAAHEKKKFQRKFHRLLLYLLYLFWRTLIMISMAAGNESAYPKPGPN